MSVRLECVDRFGEALSVHLDEKIVGADRRLAEPQAHPLNGGGRSADIEHRGIRDEGVG